MRIGMFGNNPKNIFIGWNVWEYELAKFSNRNPRSQRTFCERPGFAKYDLAKNTMYVV